MELIPRGKICHAHRKSFHRSCLLRASRVAVNAVVDELRDGSFLLRACKKLVQDMWLHMVEKSTESISLSFWCAGFLDCMIEMNSIYRGVMSEEAGFFCFPEHGIEADQAAHIVVKYLEQHPEEHDLPARSVFTFALNAAFPCKSETKKQDFANP